MTSISRCRWEGALITTLSYGLNQVIINGMEDEIIVYGCQLLFTLKMAEPVVPLEFFSLHHQQFSLHHHI